MNSDLSKCKVGDTIYTIQEGKTIVINILKGDYPIFTKDNSYTLDGKYHDSDKLPSAWVEPPEWLFEEEKKSIMDDLTNPNKIP